MLAKKQIERCFEELNDILQGQGQKGEIGIVGGAVMCLVYNARQMTRDVDAIFEPTEVIRDAAALVATRNDLPKDWLNDAAKGFLVDGFRRETVIRLSNLLVWAPEAKYMLAMKCMSARWDGSDKDDVIFLLDFLKLSRSQDVFSLIESYYPKNTISAKTKFFIEELLDA